MREFLGIDAVVFIFAPVNGFDVERVGQHEGEARGLASIGQPIPAEHAFAAHGEVMLVRLDELEEELEVVVLDVGMDPFLALPIHDADVHLAGMEIDSAIEFGGGGVILHTLLVTWCLRHRVIDVVLRGVLVTLPAHRPMLAKTNQGFHGSIKALEPTAVGAFIMTITDNITSLASVTPPSPALAQLRR